LGKPWPDVSISWSAWGVLVNACVETRFQSTHTYPTVLTIMFSQSNEPPPSYNTSIQPPPQYVFADNNPPSPSLSDLEIEAFGTLKFCIDTLNYIFMAFVQQKVIDGFPVPSNKGFRGGTYAAWLYFAARGVSKLRHLARVFPIRSVPQYIILLMDRREKT
jgi:hypothetical protein